MKLGGGAGVGLLASCRGLLRLAEVEMEERDTGESLKKCVEPLPIPKAMRALPGESEEIVMSEFRQTLHRDLGPTVVLGYDGGCPGPAIEARRGKPVAAKQNNWVEVGVDTLLLHAGRGKDSPSRDAAESKRRSSLFAFRWTRFSLDS